MFVVWSVMKQSGKYLYIVGDIGVGSAFCKGSVLVGAVVVKVDTLVVLEGL